MTEPLLCLALVLVLAPTAAADGLPLPVDASESGVISADGRTRSAMCIDLELHGNEVASGMYTLEFDANRGQLEVIDGASGVAASIDARTYAVDYPRRRGQPRLRRPSVRGAPPQAPAAARAGCLARERAR